MGQPMLEPVSKPTGSAIRAELQMGLADAAFEGRPLTGSGKFQVGRSLLTALGGQVVCRALHGRKNFLSVGPDKGGEHSAVLYALIGTAKLNGFDPEAYLVHAIDRLATKLNELLPPGSIGAAVAARRQLLPSKDATQSVALPPRSHTSPRSHLRTPILGQL